MCWKHVTKKQYIPSIDLHNYYPNYTPKNQKNEIPKVKK